MLSLVESLRRMVLVLGCLHMVTVPQISQMQSFVSSFSHLLETTIKKELDGVNRKRLRNGVLRSSSCLQACRRGGDVQSGKQICDEQAQRMSLTPLDYFAAGRQVAHRRGARLPRFVKHFCTTKPRRRRLTPAQGAASVGPRDDVLRVCQVPEVSFEESDPNAGFVQHSASSVHAAAGETSHR